MQATLNWRPAWNAVLRPARSVRLERAKYGNAHHLGRGPPGVPARVASARARFEAEARAAMREWLMV